MPPLADLANVSIQAAEKAKAKLQFMGMPTDIHLELFRHLSPTTSACLGLTCKAFYGIHWSLHVKVALEDCDPQFASSELNV